jgi:hypothetical protein
MRLHILVSAIIPFAIAGCTLHNNTPDTRELPSSGVTDTTSLGSYSVGVSRTTPPYIVICKNGKQAYKEVFETGDSLSLFQKNVDNETPATRSTVDVPKQNHIVNLADGKLPSTIIACTSTDGATKYLVFSLRDSVSKIATIPVGLGSLKAESAGDDSYELLADDWYSAWGAESISPEVLLKWDGKSLVLDQEGMKYRPPLASEIATLKSELIPQFADLPPSEEPIALAPPELAREVFSLYYSGQGKYATKLFDSCWPANRVGKKTYWNFLMQQLSHSPYWDQLKAFNR